MDLTTFSHAVNTADEIATFQIAGNIFTRMMILDTPGKKIHGHSHTFDHVTLIATGVVWMRKNGEEERHIAPKLVITPAGIEHEFECIEPSILCCVHAIRQSDDEYDVADVSITPEQGLNLIGQFPLAK